MKRIVIGMVGTVLDAGQGPYRWEKWRPTVSLCQQEDFIVDRLELIYSKRWLKLANAIASDIRTCSPETEVRLHEVEMDDPWDFEQVYGSLLDFAQRYDFKPDAEEYLIHITTGTHVAQICLFLLAESRHLPGKLIQTSPPARNRKKSTGEVAVIDLDLSKYDKLAQRFAREQREGLSFLKAGIDTRNRRFNTMIEQIEHVAIQSRAPMLLTGPTGAGKSQLARRVYELKKQRRQVTGRFVEVNCATLRGDTAMSTLFGHERGAFTGAATRRPGLLRAAADGVLMLDEVGELGSDEQAMLLRALETRSFLPVGSDREVSSNFQLIAGTNRDLLEAVHAGRFREDLLARINLWTFRLPGLAERREDLEPNIRYELDQFAVRSGANVTFNREAMQRFVKFATSPDAAWKANFRDLNAAITRMATLAPGGRINTAVVDAEIERLRAAWATPQNDEDGELLRSVLGDKRAAELDLFDRVQLAAVIRVCGECRSMAEAGRRLFAVSREQKRSVNDADRIRKYLARFGLAWGDLGDAMDRTRAFHG